MKPKERRTFRFSDRTMEKLTALAEAEGLNSNTRWLENVIDEKYRILEAKNMKNYKITDLDMMKDYFGSDADMLDDLNKNGHNYKYLEIRVDHINKTADWEIYNKDGQCGVTTDDDYEGVCDWLKENKLV